MPAAQSLKSSNYGGGRFSWFMRGDYATLESEYEQELIQRLNSNKLRMETKRIQNHIILPVAIVVMVTVLYQYPNQMIRSIIAMFMLPSVLFNLVFVLLPLYAKVYVVQRISLVLFKAVIFLILIFYIMNLVLVLGNLCFIRKFHPEKCPSCKMSPLYLCQFILQCVWMYSHWTQINTLYYWILHSKHYTEALLEATFIQSSYHWNRIIFIRCFF